MKKELMILFLVMFLVGTACAVPQTFNVNGKLTDTDGTALSGTYNMTFKIYDSYTGGSAVWDNTNSSVTTDSDGIYNVILTDVNVSDSLQYYLGITVGNDSEMTPRINLTSSMYALRANVSDSLNVSNNYEIGNLTLGQKLTFAFGELIDNLVDGWLRVTGGLNVTGNLSVNASTFFVDSENQRVGVGTTTPQNTFNVIGDGNVTGTLYVLGQNISASAGGWTRSGTVLSPTNSGDNVTVGSTDFVVDNTNGRVGIGTGSPDEKLEVSGNAKFTNGDLQFGSGGSWLSAAGFSSSGWGAYGVNFYEDGNVHKYRENNLAGRIRFDGNSIFLETAPSGTAGNEISFTTGLTVQNDGDVAIENGNVGIGTTSPNGLLNVNGTGILFNVTNTTGGDVMVVDGTSGDVIFDI